jgi:hypothetical protein
MRDALMLRLEQLSYYQHLSLTGGQERPIFTYRIVDIRGSRFHVLSRIQDAGLDFTGRTNFLAHHLALSPEEIRQFPTPPVILRDWPGWAKSWTREPTSLENEDWSALVSLAGKSSVPAQTWHRVTGDSVNGYGLLEARVGATFRVDDQMDETVLGLFAESIELLEVRDARRDFHAAALQYTFTTSMQEQDNPADFRWRCIHADNPAANRFAGPDCRNLSSVRAARSTEEEASFARTGRQAPSFVLEPQDIQITESGIARFLAKAKGIPNPAYQWFSVDRADNGQPLAGETNPELALPNPMLGKSRYVVQVSNCAGDAMSRVATLSVERKLHLAQASQSSQSHQFVSVHQKSASEIESQRNRLEAEEAERLFHRSQRRKRRLTICSLTLALVLIAIACVILMNPTLRSNFRNHLAAIRQSLPGSPNVAAATRGLSPAHKEIRSSQPSDTNTNNSAGMATSPTNYEGLTSTNDVHAEQTGTFGGFSPLPEGWNKMDIETTKASFDPLYGEEPTVGFKLSAVAKGFATNGDSTLFLCKTNAGKDFIADLLSITGTTSSVCGIMVRESKEANSPFLFLGASSSNIYVYQRYDPGRKGKPSFRFKPVELPTNKVGSPIFLKFTFTGDFIFPVYSFDATNWPETQFLDYDILTNGMGWVGFAVSSEGLSAEASAVIYEAPKPATKKQRGK